MRSARRSTLALLFAVGSAACASATKRPPQAPLYSTVPCTDACGNDMQCQAKCVETGNNPPNMPLRVGH